MADLTTLKINRTLHGELQKRAEILGMTMGDYVDRLLWMALELNRDEPVREFEALLAARQKGKKKK